jgi:dipeptidyl aminopeptidase/acylaminoacyl peptidase
VYQGVVLEAFDQVEAGIAGWSDDFKRVLVNTSGNGDSGTYYLVDLEAVRADLFGAARPAIADDQVGPISVFEYTAADGLGLDGILTLPPGQEAEDLPLVVLPHGGPHAHDGEGFDWWAQAFASRGYAVFQPNFRGSTNRDEAFVRAGYGEWGRKMQTDISDGVAELARKGIVDPARVCIVGASYGGYAALAGVTLQHDIYRCAVAVAPVADLEAFFLTNMRQSGRSRMVRRSLAEEFGPARNFDAISPRQQAAKASAPILLIHGRDDTVVDFDQSREMAEALRHAGKPVRLVELEGEDHWLSRSATRQQMLEEAVAFVQEHNPAN